MFKTMSWGWKKTWKYSGMSSDKSLLLNRWAARRVVVWNRVPQCGNTEWGG
jgi:hypothetical protein